ncbi:sialate O-acetylesterase [Sphingobacterium sp. lm-10]|uniref:sialate O-acetylesterase n=1 Tax=Sphingobacterium sp. lm-10 TaxID=2944904 RepID=UPI002022388C|nr:sialate O-acetylesterase [Sphingobacterium sp. lm-10]MCL7987448.1 sialate O-acetylesterase [Sphingobacterium sp. lm-10]
MMKNVKLLFVLCLLGLTTQAQLRLPHVLSDHMVLQRESEVQVWGWGQAGAKVAVYASWLSDTVHAVIDGGGNWHIPIPTKAAGGPYTLQVSSGSEVLKLNDLLLGDVWLCSGQSNMEWGGAQSLPEILEELPQANDPQIRLLQVSRYAASYPQEDIPNTWKLLDANSLKPFSAIGYFIAKTFRKEIGVPIGIINASWGGTGAEVWTPASVVDNDGILQKAAENQTAAAYRPHRTASLWNSMIFPLRRFPVSGIFWYQGESNVGAWSSYDRLMQQMVGAWRAAWGQQLPFYFVQIAPFTYNNSAPLAALLREQQEKTARTLANAGMVVISDLVDNVKDIHPIQKRAVADRLATLALQEHYKLPAQKDYKSPTYKSYTVKGNQVEISFENLNGKLQVKGDQITELYIAGADQVFHPAKGVVRGNKLMVSAAVVRHPQAVRFSFSEAGIANLFNSQGLPVAPFRTDNWSF